jgi:4-alpha-glucanotransferase
MKNTPSILDKRRAGILLHITSLPSTLGNGTMGKHAYRFIDFLKECGLSLWQVLPIHPPQRVPLNTPHRDFLSPYQPQSVHAGNPLLINLDKLMKKGWLPKMVLPTYNRQQLEQAIDYRYQCLKNAYSHFDEHANKADHQAYQQFVEENQEWLEDYALFCALKDVYQGACWWNWREKGYRYREPQALDKARKRFADKIEQYRFIQFAFFRQWQELQEYAHQNGVYLFGDMPFFVARDSVEVWANRDNFLLDEKGNPRYLSGISPKDDNHIRKGQCWGHPLYNWDNLQKDNFQWWINRFQKANELFDFVRLTYFRGFYQCWAIPANKPPKNGRWRVTPWRELFKRVEKEEIVKDNFKKWIAEDVGASRRTIKLRNYEFYGIKILQLAFNDESKVPLRNQHLPHHHKPTDVVYTGTHDSNTTLGWFKWITKTKTKQEYVCEYLDAKPEDFPWALIQATLRSVAKLAIIPMQDILGLDSEHRMNNPGTSNSRNWRWQFEWSQISPDKENKLKKLVQRYERN